MLRFNRSASVVCIGTYLSNNLFPTNSSSCNYDRQVPIRCTERASAKSDKIDGLTKKFAFVIIGCGVSGSAALGEILSNSKATKSGVRDILVVDSQRSAFATLGDSGILTTANMGRVQYMDGNVTEMDLPRRELKLSDGSIIKYESCLISVGASISSIDLGEKMLADDCVDDLLNMSSANSTEELMKAVRAGQHVTLVGADTWGVISIASQLADFSKLNGFKGTVSIVTPSPGVMASSLPRYLSVALGKRLSTKGIEIVPYSQVRYVGGPSTFAFANSASEKKLLRSDANYDYSSPKNAKIGIYLSRVYDTLNTSMLYTDKVALFPNSTPIANQGPPMNCSKHFAAKAGLEVGVNGGFLVNRCMLASDGVYVSGEVANVRMSLGRGVFTGVDHAHHTGLVAGRNMAGVFDVYDHIPIYEASAEESDIHLTFVGHCSSAFETHGFWWKLGSSSTSSSSPTSSSSAPSSSSSSNARNSTSTSGTSSGSNKNSSTSEGAEKQSKSRSQKERADTANEQYTQPAQQSIGERLQSDFLIFFGYPPVGEKKGNKITNYAPKGIMNVRTVQDDGLKNKLQPPLGLGVLFYVDNETVVGVLISGSPLAPQREKVVKNANDKTSTNHESNSSTMEELSFSEIMHHRARSFIGQPYRTVAATIEAENQNGDGVTDFRSGRLIRLQNLSEIAGYIIAPAILPLSSSDRIIKNIDGSGKEAVKTEYRRTSVQLPKPNYRYSAVSRTIVNAYQSNVQSESSTAAPTIMMENVFHVGGDMTGTRAEKLAAAYASGLRYGLDGPPKG